MKKTIAGVLMGLACSGVLASGDDQWVVTAETDTFEFAMKKGTGEITKNRAGDDIFVVVSRMYDRKTKNISLGKNYVTLSDCLKKQGKIVTLGLDGEYQFENDFVFDGGSAGSENAEFICAVYVHELNKMSKKGI